MQGEVNMMEKQLGDLKHSHEGWINLVTWAALPKQHPMTECDLQAGLEVLGLVYEEPWRLLMAMEEDLSQQGAPETAMMWQLVKALEDDYTKLKVSQYLLKHVKPQWEGHSRQKQANWHLH